MTFIGRATLLPTRFIANDVAVNDLLWPLALIIAWRPTVGSQPPSSRSILRSDGRLGKEPSVGAVLASYSVSS